jgi:hypothetical protein
MLKDGFIRIAAIANPLKLGFSVIADVSIEVEPTRIMDGPKNWCVMIACT